VCRLLLPNVYVYGSGLQLGGLLPFLGSRELLINVFIVASTFNISYVEPFFVVAKIIGLPGSRAVNNFVRDGPVNDVVLSPTVTSVYFVTAEN